MATEIKNAVITKAEFDTERGLTAWITLDYGGLCQAFGGHLLYGPKGWRAHNHPGNFAGHFIWRVMEVAGVSDWAKMSGKCVRAKIDSGRICALGHIIKDDWFDPEKEFTEMRVAFGGDSK